MKKLLTLVLFAALALCAAAAPVRNMPAVRIQPDGKTLNCFVSGDEFFHRLHDADDYTIVQDPETGWYVYATLSDEGLLVPTAYLPGRDNPAEVGLRPALRPCAKELRRLRALWDVPEEYREPDAKRQSWSATRLNNIVIFVRFSDETALGTEPFATYNAMFNDSTPGASSMYSYFRRASYGTLSLPTYFYPAPSGSTVLSYQDIYPRSYYRPYSATNTNGYNGDTERRNREFGLLERAVGWVNANCPVDANINLDCDNDGKVDNICFVVSGTYTGWSDLLWPHKWSLYDRNVYINGKRVYTFNLQLAGSGSHYFSVSTFCHEMTHTLGAPDLYHYDDYGSVSPAGSWDLMCSNGTPPQATNSLFRLKYMGWFDSIPLLTDSGTYTMTSIMSGPNHAYKIASADPHEWYILEYRNNSDTGDLCIPGRGMLIWRYRDNAPSNADFDFFTNKHELWLFRPNSAIDTIDGTPAQAAFGVGGRNAFNGATNPHPYLTSGVVDTTFTLSNITISPDNSHVTFTFNLGNDLGNFTTMTIGDGTSASNYTPIGTYYNYSITEQLYTAEEIGTAGTISSISFYYTGTTAKDFPITVYMQNVDAANLSTGISLAGADVVFNDTFSVAGAPGWYTITLDSPFAYDGTSNLLIGVNKGFCRWYSGDTWQYTSIANMARYTQNDNNAYTVSTVPGTLTNNRPNIQIVITPSASGGSTCDRPDSLAVASITAGTAMLTWVAGSGTFNVEYKETTATTWTRAASGVGWNYMLTGLTPATTYNVRVQSVCSDTVSAWRTATFTTACGAITSFPWSEDFESYDAGNFVHPCWVNEHIDGSGTNVFKINTSTMGGNSTHQLQLPDMAIGTQTMLRLPEMTISGNYQFVLDVYRSTSTYNSSYPNEGIRVFASADGSLEGATEITFIPRHYQVSSTLIPAEAAEGWYTYEMPIPITSGTCYIILRGESQYCTATYMDNFVVELVPPCIAPRSLTVGTPSARAVPLSWTERGTATQWTVAYKASGATDFTEVPVTNSQLAPQGRRPQFSILNTQLSYTLTGLNPETSYTVKVRANCGGADGNSAWTAERTFTTTVACPAPTGLTVTPNPHSVLLSWTENGTATAWTVAYKTADATDFTEVPVTNSQLSILNSQLSYTLTGLNPETTYTVKVRANCGTDDGYSLWTAGQTVTTLPACPAPILAASGITDIAATGATVAWSGYEENESYTVSYRTAYYVDGFVEDFATSGLPSGWSRYTGLVDEVLAGTATLSTTSSGWNTTSYAFGSYNMKLNIWGNNVEHWLITPETYLPGASALDFDLALTGYNNSNPIQDTTAQADDRFLVLVESNNTWTVLCEWNNSGSPDEYNKIRHAGEHVSLDLSAYAGQTVRIAFYGESTVGSNGDNDMHIDNVKIGNPVPAGEWTNITNATSPTTISGLAPETLYDVKVTGLCSDNAENVSATLQFTTPCAPPTDLTVTNVTNSSADLSWTENGTATSWVVAYKTVDATDYTEVPVSNAQLSTLNRRSATASGANAQLSYTLTGLTPATTYYFRVQSSCSNWSSLYAFTTDLPCPRPTALTVEGIHGYGATPCWNGSASTYNVRYRPAAITNPVINSLNFEQGGLAGWTTIDADGDGHTWALGSEIMGGGFTAHNGSDVGCSESYDYEASQALTPDNYLVSPQVPLGGSISFWAAAQDAVYPEEHFGVAVSTTGNSDTADFTTIAQWTMTAAGTPASGAKTQGAWGHYTVDLSAYAGQTGYVAIRHFDCSDQFYFIIDDIVIYGPAQAAGEWTNMTVDTNRIDLAGLSAETTYDLEVQAVCGGEDGSSAWVGTTFSTNNLTCLAPTALSASNVEDQSADLSWTGTAASYNIRYRRVQAPLSATATIILNYPNEIWYDGTGYQMLLDADATAYGTIIPLPQSNNGYLSTDGSIGGNSGDVHDSVYAKFEYKIPVNADGALNTQNVVYAGNSVSIQVPAGIYDWCITNPSFDQERIWVAAADGNVGGSQNDYLFEAGATYEFTISLAESELNDRVDVAVTSPWSDWTEVEDVNNSQLAPQGRRPQFSILNSQFSTPLTGLTPLSTYEWQVQADCGAIDGESEWSASAFFTTTDPTIDIEANKWYAIASPVHDNDGDNEAFTYVTNLLPTTTDVFAYDLFRYDEPTTTWENQQNTAYTDFDVFEQARGYIYRRDNAASLTFAGAPNTGDISIDLTADASGDLQGFNLVGNPYCHSYMLNERCYSLTTDGSWLVHNSSYDLSIAEAVMVNTTTARTLTFTENTSKGSHSTAPALAFTVKGNGLQDVAYASLTEGDGMPKMNHFNEAAPVLSIPVDGRRYAIADLGTDCQTFDMTFRGIEGEYTLTLTANPLPLTYCHLIDRATGNDIDLLAQNTYTFTHSNTNTLSDRFQVKLTPNAEESTTANFAYWNGNAWIVEGTGTLEVYDLLGRKVFTENVNSQFSIVNSQFPTTGVYVLRLGNKHQKIVVKK